ncbi:MAG: branched-chain amino acid ABC transporter permease [Elusimicrobia bacterium]|nr:branched-chain amino acid ABC transporter permease [Elusimicrobiota bacterium]
MITRGLLGSLLLSLVIAPWLVVETSWAFLIRLAGVIGLYALLALGLNLVVGFVGLLDLGFMAFYAIGAYTAALLSIHRVPFLVSLAAAVTISVLVRIAIGIPGLRLRGDYLAIVTLGFGEITRLVLNNWDSLTNGPKGLPRVGQTIAAPRFFGFTCSTNIHFYYMILVCVVLGVVLCYRIDHSRIGRAWAAIREDEVAAEILGVPVARLKLLAFAISAAFAGTAGAIFVHWERFVTPESFTFWESVLLVCAIVLGGMGSLPGVLMGAVLIIGLPEALRTLLGSQFINYRYLIFGLALMVIAVYRPQGLFPSRRRALELTLEGGE